MALCHDARALSRFASRSAIGRAIIGRRPLGLGGGPAVHFLPHAGQLRRAVAIVGAMRREPTCQLALQYAH